MHVIPCNFLVAITNIPFYSLTLLEKRVRSIGNFPLNFFFFPMSNFQNVQKDIRRSSRRRRNFRWPFIVIRFSPLGVFASFEEALFRQAFLFANRDEFDSSEKFTVTRVTFPSDGKVLFFIVRSDRQIVRFVSRFLERQIAIFTMWFTQNWSINSLKVSLSDILVFSPSTDNATKNVSRVRSRSRSVLPKAKVVEPWVQLVAAFSRN